MLLGSGTCIYYTYRQGMRYASLELGYEGETVQKQDSKTKLSWNDQRIVRLAGSGWPRTASFRGLRERHIHVSRSANQAYSVNIV